MPEAATGRPTLLLQQSGPVLAANSVGTVLAGVEEPVYTIQPQTSILNTGMSAATTTPSQLLFSFADPNDCVVTEETDDQQQQQSEVLLDSQTDVVTNVVLESTAASNLVGETSGVAIETVGKPTVSDVISVSSSDLHFSSQSDYAAHPRDANRVDTERQLDISNGVVVTEPTN
ncbi:unnamed protein product [Echinostoma caproni]|uniref:Protein grainyhead n=1 Tax=Echinostoma caproni TaxID=27848 RepID=A0A183AMT1_9TREM|nr:unnamed protein product [Echinostoma caproni]